MASTRALGIQKLCRYILRVSICFTAKAIGTNRAIRLCLTGFLLVTGFAPAQSQVIRCGSVLAKTISYQFRFTDPRLIQTEQAGPLQELTSATTPIASLGEGVWGKVFLHQNSSKEWFVLKQYRDANQVQKDARGLAYLRGVFPQEQIEGFRVAAVRSSKGKTMELAYYPGRTVQDIVEDPLTTDKIRVMIRDRYIQFLKRMISYFEGEDFLIDVRRSNLPRVSAQNDSFAMGGLHFIFKPDNIIVDPESLVFTLIDPN